VRATSLREKQRASASKYRYRQQAGEIVRRRWEANGNRCEGCGLVVSVVERSPTSSAPRVDTSSRTGGRAPPS
jgi:hypothetical protein